MLLEKNSVMANAEGAWYILKNTNEQRGDLCSNPSVLRLAKGGETGLTAPKSRDCVSKIVVSMSEVGVEHMPVRCWNEHMKLDKDMQL